MAVIAQINVKPRTPGERGLPKRPVSSVRVTRAGVEGDYNRYRHEELADDVDSALLLMPVEMIDQLNTEGWPIRPGDLGENFTTKGVPYGAFAVGRIFVAGQVRLQVSRACDPCENLFLLPYVGASRGPDFLKSTLGRRGWYARVLSEGTVMVGDTIAEEPA